MLNGRTAKWPGPKEAFFERTGNADDPKIYVEKAYDRIELEIDAKGKPGNIKEIFAQK